MALEGGRTGLPYVKINLNKSPVQSWKTFHLDSVKEKMNLDY